MASPATDCPWSVENYDSLLSGSFQIHAVKSCSVAGDYL